LDFAGIYIQAHRGFAKEQLELGLKYYTAEKVPHHKQENTKQRGIKWLKKSADQGYGLAVEKLKELQEESESLFRYCDFASLRLDKMTLADFKVVIEQIILWDLKVLTVRYPKTLLLYLVECEAEEKIAYLFDKLPIAMLEKMIALENQDSDSILCKTDNRNILRLLIENGIGLTKRELKTTKTLLYYLAKNNDIELVKLFCKHLKETHPEKFLDVLNQEVLSNQFNRETRQQQLKTALIIAAEKNNYDVVRFLVEEGADFRKYVGGLVSALDYASTCSLRNESYKILRKAWYGDVQRPLTTWEKFYTLYYCCAKSNVNAAANVILKKILPCDHIRDREGNGMLLIVMKSRGLSWEQKQWLMKILINKVGDDVNQSDLQGITPLIFAAQHDLAAVQLLLKAPGIDVDRQDNRKNTALHHAIANGRHSIVETLLAYNANPNIANNAYKNWLFFSSNFHRFR
jgi:ankyrin repeat protein